MNIIDLQEYWDYEFENIKRGYNKKKAIDRAYGALMFFSWCHSDQNKEFTKILETAWDEQLKKMKVIIRP